MNSQDFPLMLLGLWWERADPTRLLETFSRNYYRVHFITGGTGYYRTIDETTLLAESEGFVIFPGETPQYYPHEDRPWEYFWMAIRGKEMESLLSGCDLSRAAPMFRSPGPMGEMRRILADVCATSIIPAAVDQLFPYYLRDFFKNIEPFSKKSKKNSVYFEQCLSYIADHYDSAVTVQDIADSINIDRTYLYKLFKKHLGISPQAYLLNYRIDKACDLLRTTARSVTDIAYSVGFRDYSDFSRQFKAHRKISPTTYRQMNGKTDEETLLGAAPLPIGV